MMCYYLNVHFQYQRVKETPCTHKASDNHINQGQIMQSI